MKFSERMGAIPSKELQVDFMDKTLRNRLYNFFDDFRDPSIINYVADRMGFPLGSNSRNYSNLQDLFLENNEWYLPYDVLEYLIYYLKNIKHFKPLDLRAIYCPLNQILVEEKSGYRMVDGEFVRITSEIEMEEIQTAMHSPFDSVDTHIQKALALYSDRKQPDYENSIKESISAVEAMCNVITSSKGKKATLGEMLKHLKEHGVVIHQSMLDGFDKLYGFTNDARGIRHGGKDEMTQSEEDARYMLVTCSAFVNYLKDKYAKAQNGETA